MSNGNHMDFQEKLNQISSGNLDVFRQTTDEFLDEISSEEKVSDRSAGEPDKAAAAALVGQQYL